MSAPIPMTTHRLKQWVEQAQPNARLIYCPHATLTDWCDERLKDLVMELYARGWLTPHYVKAQPGVGAHHLVQRTQRPFLKGTVL